MQTIKQWLDQLGLPRYAEVLAGMTLDLEALRFLSNSDLDRSGRVADGNPCQDDDSLALRCSSRKLLSKRPEQISGD